MNRLLNFQFKDKTTIIIFAFGLILLGIIFAISFLATTQSRIQTVPQPTPTQAVSDISTTPAFDIYAGTNVERIIPSTPIPLTPGLPYSFNIYFRNEVGSNEFTFKVTYTPLYDDLPPSEVKIASRQTGPKIFEVKTLEPIREYGEYSIAVINAATKAETFRKGYMTNDVVPTPVPSNDPTLIQFLPHETESYILEFFPDRNIYIFHFKYNSDSPLGAEEQFNNAQAEAIQFIRSKGVNEKSIVIEWRNS